MNTIYHSYNRDASDHHRIFMPSIEEFEAWIGAHGGPSALAEKIRAKHGPEVKISQPAISNWVIRRRIPEDKRSILEAMDPPWVGPWEWPKEKSDLLRPLAPMDDQAAVILEDMVFKGHPWREDLKREMVDFVAEQMLELQIVGYSGYALEKEIRERIRQWQKIANGPGTAEAAE